MHNVYATIGKKSCQINVGSEIDCKIGIRPLTKGVNPVVTEVKRLDTKNLKNNSAYS